MKQPRKTLVIGSTALALFCSATWIAIIVSSQQPGGGSTDNDVTVCVGSDSVLRAPTAGVCPAASRRISLAGPDIKKADSTDENDPLGPTKNSAGSNLDPRLAELEKRISELENAGVFEVDDKQGNVIFSVAPGKVQMYNENKTAVAAMFATSEGGQYVARSTENNLTAYLGSYGQRAGLRLSQGDSNLSRLDLLRQVSGNYAFKIPSAFGPVAGIGQSKAGSGVVVVGNNGGQTKALMGVDGSQGVFNVYNSGSNPVATLRESGSGTGSGLLALGDASGSMVVKMGTNVDNRYGVVLALPLGFPYVPRSGLPGSYFLGCVASPGGRACLP